MQEECPLDQLYKEAFDIEEQIRDMEKEIFKLKIAGTRIHQKIVQLERDYYE